MRRRGTARRDEAGAYVPLSEQDTGLWDAHLIGEAETALSRANRLTAIGRFQIEAAIQSAHTARKATGRTDWVAIEQLYAALER
ncbi:MAG: hypothetical protein QM734_05735 [Cyclobacteriaceae bacterium]